MANLAVAVQGVTRKYIHHAVAGLAVAAVPHNTRDTHTHAYPHALTHHTMRGQTVDCCDCAVHLAIHTHAYPHTHTRAHHAMAGVAVAAVQRVPRRLREMAGVVRQKLHRHPDLFRAEHAHMVEAHGQKGWPPGCADQGLLKS